MCRGFAAALVSYGRGHVRKMRSPQLTRTLQRVDPRNEETDMDALIAVNGVIAVATVIYMVLCPENTKNIVVDVVNESGEGILRRAPEHLETHDSYQPKESNEMVQLDDTSQSLRVPGRIDRLV